MTHSRLGKSKRLAAFFCALLLTLETVAFPLTQAKAAAIAALATVGFGVTTAAFLAACGIYPYWVDDSSAVNFDWEGWVDDDLTVLVNEYNAANSTTPINPNQISAFLSGATLLVGNYAWEKLCDFAEWIKTEYAVTDNQTGVELGETLAKSGVVPYVGANSYTEIKNIGLLIGQTQSSGLLYYASILSDNLACIFLSGSRLILFPVKNQPLRSYSFARQAYGGGYTSVIQTETTYYDYNGVRYYYYSIPVVTNLNPDIPVFSSMADGFAYFVGGQSVFQGITADTSTVSIPDALPEGTEYGGLRVSGLPAATTAESVTDAVQDSVGERLKTPVEVVEVELAPGTEVDSETGVITQNPVVIEAPVEETIPALSALVPAQEFLSALSEAMQTKFPFCLPFDFMRVLQAFAKSPDAPVITMTFFDRIGGGNYTVTVDLSPWDDVASVVRRLESMILFLGFWLNFDKFNVLNIILGQIG